MIADALEFLRREMQFALHLDDDTIAAGSPNTRLGIETVWVTLVNVLEDATFRRESPPAHEANTTAPQSGDATTLHVLCAFASQSYLADVHRLSQLLAWVRRTPVFHADATGDAHVITTNTPLPASIDSLILERLNLRADELRDIWSMLGHPYVPSVVLRVRVLHRTAMVVSPVPGHDPDRRSRRATTPIAWQRTPDTSSEWKDLRIGLADRNALQEVAVAHAIDSAKGTTLLFEGPASAAKQLAASLLGKDAARPVYRIDLSRVVSEYIGETEKNLGRLFDEVAGTGAVLFFDEADALFGKRTTVGDAHDRYANQEVSYLMQRLETHDGLSIIASTERANMDNAFVRRLRASITFPDA